MVQWVRICLQYRRHRRCGFDPRVGNIPWKRKWQPTPIVLPGKFHGQGSLVGCCPWGHKELNTTRHKHRWTGSPLGLPLFFILSSPSLLLTLSLLWQTVSRMIINDPCPLVLTLNKYSMFVLSVLPH